MRSQPPTWPIYVIPYNRAGTALRFRIAQLQSRAEHATSSCPDDSVQPRAIPQLHDPALDALCFYLVDDHRIVSYAAVVHKFIQHDRENFSIAGLSCVATDPDYRHHGRGMCVVGAATNYIEQSNADFGIFTCDPELESFYGRAGRWMTMPTVRLIGSHDNAALSSASLHKIVLMRFFSEKARLATKRFENTTVSLDFPIGQFL